MEQPTKTQDELVLPPASLNCLLNMKIGARIDVSTPFSVCIRLAAKVRDRELRIADGGNYKVGPLSQLKRQFIMKQCKSFTRIWCIEHVQSSR